MDLRALTRTRLSIWWHARAVRRLTSRPRRRRTVCIVILSMGALTLLGPYAAPLGRDPSGGDIPVWIVDSSRSDTCGIIGDVDAQRSVTFVEVRGCDFAL